MEQIHSRQPFDERGWHNSTFWEGIPTVDGHSAAGPIRFTGF